MHKRNMIVSVDENFAIGKAGKIPWKLSADMEFFKKTTTATKIVVMGRKTYLSLPKSQQPLPERLNVILSRDKKFKIQQQGCLTLHSVDDFLKVFGNVKFYVIGGQQIYEAFLPYISRVIITHVETKISKADTFFPRLSGMWKCHTLLDHVADERNDYHFSIIEYTRKPPSK